MKTNIGTTIRNFFQELGELGEVEELATLKIKLAASEKENKELLEQIVADNNSFIDTCKKLYDKNEALTKELAASKQELKEINDCAAGIKPCPACEKEAAENKEFDAATKEWEENRKPRK